MPARGWYERNEKELVRSNSDRQVKQPYFICAPNAEGIAFAGLWAVWKGQDGLRCFPAPCSPRQQRQASIISMTACPWSSSPNTSITD
ncbi:SOS response-associated peptidase family protein [Desulfomicrobium norvegicum]|uniref:SOS response-associated peptidase family protein n=1 Tax=Desulfomicrobium norvegicum (strain DSM 1741 / NCIMB 8310) TaxID=52561 RepID=UPI000B872085